MSVLGSDEGLSETPAPAAADGAPVPPPAAAEASAPMTTLPPAFPPALPEPADPAAAAPHRLRRLLGSTVAVLVVLALIAGGLAVALRPTHAPRLPAALPRPAAAMLPSPAQTGTNPDGTHYGPLTGFLAPIPPDYSLGPDDGYFGDDGAVTAQQLASANNELVRTLGAQLGLPQKDIDRGLVSPSQVRKTLRAAVISYVSMDSKLDVTIDLQQLAHAQDAAQRGHDEQQLNEEEASIVGRATFAVPGYPHAGCVHLGAATDKLDEIQCYAVSGDVVTYLTAQGVAPISQHTVVALMERQLKLLQSEGASA